MMSDNNAGPSKRSITNQTWQFPQIDQTILSQLQCETGASELVAGILCSRGICTAKEAADFLNPQFVSLMPDPSSLHDVDKAIGRIIEAMERNESICIWGDYDVDGTVSVSLFLRFFKAIGYGNVSFYIPDRLNEGYGLNSQGIKKLSSGSLLISVDCGTSNVEEIKLAHSLNIDTIIIDHHEVGALPESLAFINPHKPDQSDQDLKELCAAGLVFLFLIALSRELRARDFYKSIKEPDVREYLGMVSLATVCDVMRLVKLNRAYVFHGLKRLCRRSDKHIERLAEAAGLSSIENAGHLGFILGPRINAAGRVGDDSSMAVAFFACNNDDEMQSLADKLNQTNIRRKEIETDNLKQAEAAVSLNKPYLLAACENLHPGVIGIVASRLKEKHNKPAFVIGLDKDVCRGSVRSVEGFDVGAFIQSAVNAGVLANGGGHKMAAGFSIMACNLSKFESMLDDAFRTFEPPTPTAHVDGILALSALNAMLFSDIAKLEPFGIGNPAPRFMFPRLAALRIEVLKEKHIRCILADETGKTVLGYLFNGVGAALGKEILNLNPGRRIDVLGTVRSDLWQGKKQIKILIEDFADA
ncbi:MAG: single-stranded-DNA-specific exonuclease RecJ [Holosporales bacterium]|jgi:single-stranded-DNA-specific exonuclease|nr:single-stranded-DNA-specific exonuclease RecJ [Holosporales bacterium]